MAIQMTGGIYCPLSPRDPPYRLTALVQQTQSRLVLVHWPTRTKVNDNSVTIFITRGIGADRFHLYYISFYLEAHRSHTKHTLIYSSIK